MFNEANEPSSACRLWRIFMVETSTPPSKRNGGSILLQHSAVKEPDDKSQNRRKGRDSGAQPAVFAQKCQNLIDCAPSVW